MANMDMSGNFSTASCWIDGSHISSFKGHLHVLHPHMIHHVDMLFVGYE